jgi:uncharacterized membrane protein YphA (DoxX/SURF4 family)
MNSKTGKIIYWILTGLVAFVFIGSGSMKLMGGAGTEEMAQGLGGGSNMMVLGALEILIALIWLVPKTGIIGALLAVAYMGGATAVHFVNNQPLLVPVLIQVLIWIATVYRFPELKQRILGKATAK